jgi:hypothetical protein
MTQHSTDFDLEFKIPDEDDFACNKREYKALSFKQYLEFVELGLKMGKGAGNSAAYGEKRFPTVRFEFK